jgi:Ca-activated chloride channel family protein
MINRLLPRQVPDLFAGEQLLVLGRYRKSGQATLKITGQVDSGTREYEFPVQFAETDRNASRTFVAKLWANRRVGEIIDELDLNGKNEELVKELVQLATEHGIVTPYTSYLADENANRDELALGAQTERARRGLERLGEASGQDAFEQRAAKGMFLESKQVQSGPAFAGGVPGAPQGIRYLKEQVAFKRGKLVVTPETSQIDLEKNRGEIQTIEKFSDAYFKLIAANDAEQNELLSSQADDEELLVKLRGQVYLIR